MERNNQVKQNLYKFRKSLVDYLEDLYKVEKKLESFKKLIGLVKDFGSFIDSAKDEDISNVEWFRDEIQSLLFMLINVTNATIKRSILNPTITTSIVQDLETIYKSIIKDLRNLAAKYSPTRYLIGTKDNFEFYVEIIF